MSDYETAQRKRNVTVGIFALVAVCSLVWLIYKFGDLPVKVSELNSFKVFVQFPTAQGVQKNTPVRFCGYQVGRVTDVEPPRVLRDLDTSRFYHQAVVVLSIDRKYDNIPSDVDVKLMTRGLGSSYIELIVVVDPVLPRAPHNPNQPGADFLVDKVWLQGSTGMTSEFFPAESQKKLEELVDGLSALVDNANDLLGDEENKENFRATLTNLSKASEQATQALKEFQEFFIAGTDASEELSKAVAQLRVILEKINDGQGTAASLVNDGRLYENLLENTHEMQALLQELKSFLAKAKEKGVPIKLK